MRPSAGDRLGAGHYDRTMTAFDPDYSPPAGLSSLLSGLLATTHERHMDMIALVTGLPEGGLTWAAGADAAHISGLTMHILEVEEHLAHLAAGDEVHWAGKNGSSMDVVADETTLIARITEVDGALKRAIERIPPERLERHAPGNERTIGAALVEDLDHCAMHYGQLQLTRHFYELAHPRFESRYEHWR